MGLANEASDPEQAKIVWTYDPHLNPALQFDNARASAEQLIDAALAGNDPAAMRHALEELRRMSAPYLQWTCKAGACCATLASKAMNKHALLRNATALRMRLGPALVALRLSSVIGCYAEKRIAPNQVRGLGRWRRQSVHHLDLQREGQVV